MWPDQICRNFATLAIFYGLFLTWQNAESTLAICEIIGQIFIAENGQILKKQSGHLVILSPIILFIMSKPRPLSHFYFSTLETKISGIRTHIIGVGRETTRPPPRPIWFIFWNVCFSSPACQCINRLAQAVWPDKNRQMSIKVTPKTISQEKWMILTPLQKLPKNVEDLGKLIVAKGLKKLPKVQKSPNLVTLSTGYLQKLHVLFLFFRKFFHPIFVCFVISVKYVLRYAHFLAKSKHNWYHMRSKWKKFSSP